MTTQPRDVLSALESMVDWQRGLISPQVFSDEEVYRQEIRRLFRRAWLFLAHECMLPDAGDYVTAYMGTEPVIVVRQADGSVAAFLNACRHRGMRICGADHGNTRAFSCNYHGWTYDTSGNLVNVPNLEQAYHGELDMGSWGLVKVAQVESYKGWVFGTFDPTAPPLVEFLGDAVYYFDALLDRRPGGTELLPGTMKWVFQGNWKLAAEQFAGDLYHASTSHLSAAVARAPDEQFQVIQSHLKIEGRQFTSRLGHGCGFPFDIALHNAKNLLASDTLHRYYEDALPRIAERLGEPRARGPITAHMTIFPNLSLGPSSGHVRLWQPRGPHSFEVWAWIVVDKDMSPEEKEANRRAITRLQSAGGIVEQDDGENWGEIAKTLRSSELINEYPFNYQMGLGHEVDDDPDYPGRIGYELMGEGPQRGFYRRWLEFMTSETWPYVDPAEVPMPTPRQLGTSR